MHISEQGYVVRLGVGVCVYKSECLLQIIVMNFLSKINSPSAGENTGDFVAL